MGVYQPVIRKYAETYGPVGSRFGDGHRPARQYHAALPVAQVDSITIDTQDDATTYTTTIDGIDVVLLGTAGADAAGLAVAFVDAINGHATLSQIVRADDQGSGVYYLTARKAGVAFTATATESGGGGGQTRAAVTANNAGVALNPGDPVFRAASGTNAGLVRLPAAVTDIFAGLVQFRHEDAELETAYDEDAYEPGDQVPVDPDGQHVVLCADGCNVGDPVYVTMTTGALRSTGTGAQVSRVTISDSTPSDSVLFTIRLRLDDTGEVFLVEYAADADSTDTEIRDGLGDFITAHLASAGFTSADVSTNAIDITGPAGRPFTVLLGQVAAEMTATVQTAAGSFLLANARWEAAASAGAKTVMSHWVP